MIQLICPHCGELLNLPDKFAGTVGRCKHCKQRVVVPVQPIIAPAPGQDLFDHLSACVDAAKRGKTFDHDWVPRESPRMPITLKWKPVLGFALAVFVLILLGGYCTIHMRQAKEAGEKARIEQCRKAYMGAQDIVKGAIKYPDTLKFPPFESSSVLGPFKNGKFTVSGYCDTTNDLGKKVRTNYTCTVRLQDAVWQCDSINLIER